MKTLLSSAMMTTYRLATPIIDPRRLWRGITGYPRYIADFIKYRSLMTSATQCQKTELFPCLDERTTTTRFDPHYCYLAYWATQRLQPLGSELPHVDVGSSIAWVMSIAAVRRTTFVDIRPIGTLLPNLEMKVGSILNLPFPDESVPSLSCLHVAEHIGLGRYGDPLEPNGTLRAIAELARVLSPTGRLLFAVPVGRERTCFNAHRILSPDTVIAIGQSVGLRLASFAGVGDDRVFREAIEPSDLADSEYACGMFEFVRHAER
jgi:SAM-dependent methyltransferase